jgi:NTP pyrophosphatase (non-canonical NTP hydrolase)
MDINEIARKQFDWVERMGWHNKTVLESLALIASEVGEAVNECRGEKPTENFGIELADIVLRVADLAQTHGVDLALVIVEKMAINEKLGTKGRLV